MRKNLHDRFVGGIHAHWTKVTAGGAFAEVTPENTLKLGYSKATPDRYVDAQVDDYTMLSKKDYLWKRPLSMTVRARFSHQSVTEAGARQSSLHGTAGFGFWNKPFTMQGNWFTAPQAVWFFYTGAESELGLVPGLSANGWKAQVVNTKAGRSLLYTIPTAFRALYSRISGTNSGGKSFQKFTGSDEHTITQDMREWHTYRLEWRRDRCTFYIDDEQVFETKESPRRALGLVVWLDNEYAIATPKGELGFGKVKACSQWMEIDFIKVAPL